MKILLCSLALVAVSLAAPTAPPTEPADDDRTQLTAILKLHNATDEAIAEFFEKKIDVLPFTKETFRAYQNWTHTWKIEIPEFEAMSNDVIKNAVSREIAKRTVAFFARMGERAALLVDIANYASEDAKAKLSELLDNSSIFEAKLLNKVAGEMMNQIYSEWGIEAFEGAIQEPEQPEEVDDEKGNDDDDEGEVEATTAGEKGDENEEQTDEDEEKGETATPEGEKEDETEEQPDEDEGNVETVTPEGEKGDETETKTDEDGDATPEDETEVKGDEHEGSGETAVPEGEKGDETDEKTHEDAENVENPTGGEEPAATEESKAEVKEEPKTEDNEEEKGEEKQNEMIAELAAPTAQ